MAWENWNQNTDTWLSLWCCLGDCMLHFVSLNWMSRWRLKESVVYLKWTERRHRNIPNFANVYFMTVPMAITRREQGCSFHIGTYARGYSWHRRKKFFLLICPKAFFSLNLLYDNLIFFALYWCFYIRFTFVPDINHSVLAERSLSRMKRLKSPLRSTMKDERLSTLAGCPSYT